MCRIRRWHELSQPIYLQWWKQRALNGTLSWSSTRSRWLCNIYGRQSRWGSAICVVAQLDARMQLWYNNHRYNRNTTTNRYYRRYIYGTVRYLVYRQSIWIQSSVTTTHYVMEALAQISRDSRCNSRCQWLFSVYPKSRNGRDTVCSSSLW